MKYSLPLADKQKLHPVRELPLAIMTYHRYTLDGHIFFSDVVFRYGSHEADREEGYQVDRRVGPADSPADADRDPSLPPVGPAEVSRRESGAEECPSSWGCEETLPTQTRHRRAPGNPEIPEEYRTHDPETPLPEARINYRHRPCWFNGPASLHSVWRTRFNFIVLLDWCGRLPSK